MSANTKIYPGLDADKDGGMTDVGRILRDAQVFGILPEDETCAGWDYDRIMAIYDQVHAAWGPYGHSVSRLPDELRERHQRIYAKAIERARSAGWDPDLSDES